jgi:hypothetical protein
MISENQNALDCDYSSLHFDYQYLFYVFKPKDFLNRHLYALEKVSERQRASSLLIQ